MIYTSLEIQNIKDNTVCCLGDIASDISKKMAMGMDYSGLSEKFDKAFMYLVAIETWVQASDGTVPSSADNILSENQKDFILSKLQDLCNCGCEPVETSDGSSVDRYVVDGYLTDGYLIVK